MTSWVRIYACPYMPTRDSVSGTFREITGQLTECVRSVKWLFRSRNPVTPRNDQSLCRATSSVKWLEHKTRYRHQLGATCKIFWVPFQAIWFAKNRIQLCQDYRQPAKSKVAFIWICRLDALGIKSILMSSGTCGNTRWIAMSDITSLY